MALLALAGLSVGSFFLLFSFPFHVLSPFSGDQNRRFFVLRRVAWSHTTLEFVGLLLGREVVRLCVLAIGFVRIKVGCKGSYIYLLWLVRSFAVFTLFFLVCFVFEFSSREHLFLTLECGSTLSHSSCKFY